LTVCHDNRSDDENDQTTSCGSNGQKWNASGTLCRIVVMGRRHESAKRLDRKVDAAPDAHNAGAFDADAFLRFAGAGKTIVTYQPTDVIFSQGDASDNVLYIQKGAVKLSVLSHGGKEAVVADARSIIPS
jgi:CRP-like cAMP-binding protein